MIGIVPSRVRPDCKFGENEKLRKACERRSGRRGVEGWGGGGLPAVEIRSDADRAGLGCCGGEFVGKVAHV